MKTILGLLLLCSAVSADIYLGCFLDKSTRLLDGKSTSSNDMTVQKCSSFCKDHGYIFYGVQYYTQCFCGNTLKTGYSKKSELECNANCGGDSKQKCGGTWRMNVYRMNDYRPNVNVAKPKGVYLGCFLDKSARLLDGKFTSSNDMTVEKCYTICKNNGYVYFGVQYSSQCFCGNKIDKVGYGKRSKSDCSAKCTGDNSQTCGGTWRMSVYEIHAEYLGCYLDKSNRLLEAKFTHGSDMTLEKCFKTCSHGNYKYAGVQYSGQCFCGNNVNKSGYGKRPETECAAKCNGDKNQICGGTWRMSVYKL